MAGSLALLHPASAGVAQTIGITVERSIFNAGIPASPPPTDGKTKRLDLQHYTNDFTFENVVPGGPVPPQGGVAIVGSGVVVADPATLYGASYQVIGDSGSCSLQIDIGPDTTATDPVSQAQCQSLTSITFSLSLGETVDNLSIVAFTGLCSGQSFQFSEPVEINNNNLGSELTVTSTTPGVTFALTLDDGNLGEQFNLSNIRFNVPPAQPGCGDTRDAMISAYTGVAAQAQATGKSPVIIPACKTFTKDWNSPIYTFSQYINHDNKGCTTKSPWALARGPLLLPASSKFGLNQWNQLISTSPFASTNGAPHHLDNGYRDPVCQQAINPQATSSRHQFGDAVDIKNNSFIPGLDETDQSAAQAEHDALADFAISAGAGFVEATAPKKTNPCGFKCIHADWRYLPGPYFPQS